MRNGLGYALQPMRQYALRRVWHFTTDEQIAHTCETLCIGNSVQSFFNGTLRISGTATTGIVGSAAQEAYPHGQGLSFIFHSGRPRPCTADRKIRRHNCQDRSLAVSCRTRSFFIAMCAGERWILSWSERLRQRRACTFYTQ